MVCPASLHFTVAKLLDWTGCDARLHDRAPPFAALTLTHLATLATRHDPVARCPAKWSPVKRLYQLDFDRQQLTAKGMQEGRALGREQGCRAGKAQVIERQLLLRFGDLPAWTKTRLAEASEQQLDAWIDKLLNAPSIEAAVESTSH